MTFTTAFQNDFASGNAYQCSYDFYANYKKGSGVSERERIGVAWIQTGITTDNIRFTHTFSDLDKMDFETSGIEMNFSTNDVFGKFAGYIYIESISFEGASL